MIINSQLFQSMVLLYMLSFSKAFIPTVPGIINLKSLHLKSSSESQPISAEDLSELAKLKGKILQTSATSGRGENSQPEEKDQMSGLVMQLEASNPTKGPAASLIAHGTWELVYSNTNLFRSSPFFMAGRAVCEDGEQADRFNMFCDLHRAALAHTQIGRVRQIVSADSLVSEFETVGSVLPGLPFVIKGTIESTADIVDISSQEWTLNMRSTKIKTGTSNVPILKDFLDSSEGLPIQQLRSLLEGNVPGYNNPTPVFRTYYLDNDMRVSRDQDDNFFVYIKLADD